MLIGKDEKIRKPDNADTTLLCDDKPCRTPIEVAGLDELFPAGRPVLVGADIHSTYCFLLTQEHQRDGDPWALRLMEQPDQGFAPKATVADFGTGIRAGVKQALPETPCRGDVFPAVQDLTTVCTYLDNRAYRALAAYDNVQSKLTKAQCHGRDTRSLGRQRARANREQHETITLADEVAVLADWLRTEVFTVSGQEYAERCALYEFILAELQARQPLCPHQIGKVCTLLNNHREELLAFADLEEQLHRLGTAFEIAVPVVRAMLELHLGDPRRATYWQTEATLRGQLGGRFATWRHVAEHTRRSSSIIENLNSRLRNYFFLRGQLGNDYLHLLQFFLNHKRFDRREGVDRVGRSRAELLPGREHPHWLAMLGDTRFSRNGPLQLSHRLNCQRRFGSTSLVLPKKQGC